MESFMELAKRRWSCRQFTEEPVRPEHLEKILEAGLIAPTGHNNQPLRIIVLKGEEDIAKLQRISRCHFGAKSALFVCWNREEAWERKYDGYRCGETDAAIVTTHMLLEAEELGVAACWVHFFKPEVAREELNLPAEIVPVNILLLGYAAPEAAPGPMHFSFRDPKEIVFEHGLPEAKNE